MTISWRKPEAKLLDEVELNRVNKVAGLLNIVQAKAIDSYSMSPDGPVLTSVFLVSDLFLAEVRLDSKHLSFDVADRTLLFNYRVVFEAAEYRPPTINQTTTTDKPPATSSTENDLNKPASEAQSEPATLVPYVEVSLRHTENMTSKLCCFGDAIDDWLAYVMASYPPAYLTAGRRNGSDLSAR